MTIRWLVWLFLPAILFAQSPTPTPRTQRLAEIGRLWGRLKWVHPALAEGNIDWDRQLVEILPVMAAAETLEAQRSAINHFVAPLADPCFILGNPPEFRPVKAEGSLPLVQWLSGGTALINLNHNLWAWDSGFKARVKEIEEILPRAKGLIFDLRPVEESDFGATDLLNSIIPKIIPHQLELPAGRYLYNRGWPSQSFTTSGGYFTAWLSLPHEQVMPASGAKPLPMVFIINRWTPIPPLVLALQRTGLAFIVSELKANLGWVAPTENFKIGTEIQLTFRVGDLVHSDGSMGFGADRVVPLDSRLGPGCPAVEAALSLLKSRSRPGIEVHWATPPAKPRSFKEKSYREMQFPDLPYRQLAVIKLWAIIDAFFPYKNLMDQPWNEALPEFLARMERVQDARGYALCMAEMAARLQDNHVRVSDHPEIAKFRGEASLPIGLSSVEGRVLVERILDAVSAPGVKKWDEVIEIDGVPVDILLKKLDPFVASANPWTRDRNLARYLGRGEDGKATRVALRRSDGSVYSLLMKRSKANPGIWADSGRENDVVQILQGNIGYADLDRLETSQVDGLLERVKDCPWLILDMRGYPHGTAWTLAPRLNVKGAGPAAAFYPNVICGLDTESEDTSTVFFLQKIPEGHGKSLFRGKVIMLISEATQSQAEHTGLFMEVACGVTFIGSPTAGSNGDVTDVVLPGGLTVSFTGQGVRHADGRQLQRIGLKPDIAVHRTVKGLREGKDEVLERAIRFIETGK
jgi:Peptidase family S41